MILNCVRRTQHKHRVKFLFNLIIHILIHRLTAILKMTFSTLKSPFLPEKNLKILLRPEKTLEVLFRKEFHSFETQAPYICIPCSKLNPARIFISL
jgi:hypothetical protein